MVKNAMLWLRQTKVKKIVSLSKAFLRFHCIGVIAIEFCHKTTYWCYSSRVLP